MAVRIQPDFSANQGINPQRIEAAGIGEVREKYFKDMAANKPGQFDNQGRAAYVDPFDLQADGSYQMNAWTAGRNRGTDAFVDVEVMNPAYKLPALDGGQGGSGSSSGGANRNTPAGFSSANAASAGATAAGSEADSAAPAAAASPFMTKRVPAWQAQAEFYNTQGLKNFSFLSDRLERLQGSGLATIKDLINQAYSKIG